MPGVQKPHWLAPLAAKASTQRALSDGGRPSTVVTERPATRRNAVTHATRAAPSIQTVQHPHCPWGLHPSLTEWQLQLLAQRVQEGGPLLVHDGDRRAVEGKGDGRSRGGLAQLKEDPQPQVRVALGFEMWNPAPCNPSL